MTPRSDTPQIHGPPGPQYCAFCSGPLADGHDSGFPVCESCGRVSYLDPKLAAAAMVEIDNELLLVRRAIQPAYGKWSFPSGYVNRGEQVERAAEREVLEETGLEVRTDWLVGLYSEPGKSVVLAVYSASVVGGDLIAGDETLDSATFPYDRLPELAFGGDAKIVEEWLTGKAGRTLPGA